jgi:hypothetical protein
MEMCLPDQGQALALSQTYPGSREMNDEDREVNLVPDLLHSQLAVRAGD